MPKTLIGAAMAMALNIPMTAAIAESADIAELKQMIRQLKHQHEQQMRELEERVQRAEARAAAAEEKALGTAGEVAIIEQRAQTRPGTGSNAFNPAISLVLQGGLASYSQDPDDFHLEGLPLGGEAGLQDEGLSLWETELTASANVDNLFFGQATLGLHTDDGAVELDIEEAFVDTLSLPAGLGLRFGRFYSAIGYLNEHHTHTWDFADAPLAYQAFLARQYRDDGIRASWLAPVDTLLLEIGVEALRGDSYPGGGNDGDFGAVRNLFAKIGGDAGQDSSWQIGLAHLDVDVAERTSGGHSHDHGGDGPVFSGDSGLTVFDAIWKTSLSGDRALIVQGEYLLRDEDGQVDLAEEAGNAVFDYDGRQYGWYLQTVFQFNRRWRAGLRYDRLSANNDLAIIANDTGEADDDILAESGYQSGSHDPHRWAAMVDWSPSEFSRFRLQYARDDSREETDDQVFLQYITNLGAHGAHRY
ncbi:MAG: TonB-dependent receptor [Chromatiales bacterium]|nr:TonB-dependent receptor [Chromatiales bacterium]